MKKKDFFRWDESLEDYVKAIYVREDTKSVIDSIGKKRRKLLGLLLVLAVIAFAYCWCQPEENSILTGNQLVRQEEATQVDLLVKGNSGGEQWEFPVSMNVDTRQFNEGEKQELTKKVKSYLEKRIKGTNKSLECVKEKLFLPQGISGTGIEIQWSMDDDYILSHGELNDKKIPSSGVSTELLATASWKNWEEKFYFPVHLVGKQYTPREQEIRRVKKALAEAGEKQKEKACIQLPEKVEDVTLQYEVEKNGKSYVLAYLILGTIMLIPVLWKRQQQKELQQREEQLSLDHPQLINKFMLLLGAGMTVRKAVERLTDEYENARKNGGKKRYVYEELCVMNQEMKEGISESQAIQHFGKRCGILPYLRFSSIMTQNIKKGSEGLITILEKESLDALEQRKEMALQLGEKASTKLLFPMMLMLGIVMAVIMVPAFMTM